MNKTYKLDWAEFVELALEQFAEKYDVHPEEGLRYRWIFYSMDSMKTPQAVEITVQ